MLNEPRRSTKYVLTMQAALPHLCRPFRRLLTMANAEPSHNVSQQPVSVFAAVLSYLVPGLGQIYQGRVAKGLLFMVCLYGLFFYGMYLGSWSNVYLPDTVELTPPPV